MARLDAEWDQEREQYLITLRDGNRVAPKSWHVLAGGLAFVLFISVYEVGACAVALEQMAEAKSPPAFPWAPFLGLPLLGLLFGVAGVGGIRVHYRLAFEYRKAQQRYQARRAALTLEPRRHVPGPCLARSGSGRWWRAAAVAERDGLFLIQYQGWSARWDDWLSRESVHFPDDVD